jgi:uroporphyrinogen III methyltransferase / synthase
METVVITASAGAFPGLVETLSALPLRVEECPLITFEAPPDWAPLDLALDRLSSYGAIAVTSPRAATSFADRIVPRRNTSWPRNNPPVLWAAGAATAAGLRDLASRVRTPGPERTGSIGAAAGLALAMIEGGAVGPVLFPCGNNHRDELPDRLRRAGIEVDEVVCYTSTLSGVAGAQAAAERATIVVVASPSVAHLLAQACPPGSRPDLIAAGPTTAASARASGWIPAATATDSTAEAVGAAVREVLATRASHE